MNKSRRVTSNGDAWARTVSKTVRVFSKEVIPSTRSSSEPPNRRAIKMLVSGPTTVTMNSVKGRRASWDRWETPPKKKRVMLWTGMPLRRATKLWESSWTRTERKKAMATPTANPHCPTTGQPG